MEKYKQKLKLRIVFLLIGAVLTAVLFFICSLFQKSMAETEANAFIRGFQTGIFAAMEGIMLFTICRYLGALRKDSKFKKIYIQETDERKQLIALKSTSLGQTVSAYLLLTATVISGFFNTTVFFTLLAAVLAISSVSIFLKLYFCRRL